MNQQINGTRSKITFKCDVCGFTVNDDMIDDIGAMMDHLKTHPIGSSATSTRNPNVALTRPDKS